MTVSELLTKHEGRKKKPYKCPAGANTIGVGWNYDATPLPTDIAASLAKHGQITEEMIDRLLEISIRHATLDCRVLFPEFNQFSPVRQMALIDFVFQLGFRRARCFAKSIAAINTGRWEDAAKEMQDSAWYQQVPKRAQRICEMVELGD